jgi:hypothetical protein
MNVIFLKCVLNEYVGACVNFAVFAFRFLGIVS